MDQSSSSARLSERERQLLTLAAKGLTDAEIGKHLEISETTVKSYWGRVRTKLGPRNRTELVALSLGEERRHEIEHLTERVRDLERRLLEGTHSTTGLHQTILDEAPDAVLAIDADGLVLYANHEAERMFGYSQSELAGIEISRLVPPRFRDRHKRHLKGYQAEPGNRRMGENMGTVGIDKLGNEFSVSATLSRIETNAGAMMVCLLRQAASGDRPMVDRYGIPRF